MDGGTNPRHVATPQRIRWFVLGRSPGLEVLVHRLPGPSTQWHADEPALPYRCGGSAGIERIAWLSPASRFTRHGKPCTGTTNRG